MKYLLGVFGLVTTLFASAAFAAVPEVTYDPAKKLLSVSAESCLYGRGVQAELKQRSFEQIHTYLKTNVKSLIGEYSQQHKLKRSVEEYMELLLTTKLDANSLKHQFSLVGNDTCTVASVAYQVADEVDFSQLFEFSSPKNLHLVSTERELKAKVEMQLQNHQTDINWNLIPNYLFERASFKQLNETQTYYQFNLSDYRLAAMQAVNTVFIEGEGPIVRLLKQYLQDNSFKITQSASTAFWHLKASAKTESEQYLSITLNIDNQKNKSTLLVNNSRQLPPVNLSQPQVYEKFAKVHFELMKLSEVLSN